MVLMEKCCGNLFVSFFPPKLLILVCNSALRRYLLKNGSKEKQKGNFIIYPGKGKIEG